MSWQRHEELTGHHLHGADRVAEIDHPVVVGVGVRPVVGRVLDKRGVSDAQLVEQGEHLEGGGLCRGGRLRRPAGCCEALGE